MRRRSLGYAQDDQRKVIDRGTAAPGLHTVDDLLFHLCERPTRLYAAGQIAGGVTIQLALPQQF